MNPPEFKPRHTIGGLLAGLIFAALWVSAACGGPPGFRTDPTPTAVHIPTATATPDDAAIIAACIRAMKTAPVKDTSGWSEGAQRLYESGLDLAHSELADVPGAIENFIRTDIENGELTPDILQIMRFVICPRTDSLLELPPSETETAQ